MSLKEIGINPFPILAGAGIFGLAISLGAQNLMNDMLSGFTILIENYFLVGDYVKIRQAEGIVESFDILNTRIRDEDGRLHIIRNGDVKDIINYSKEYTNAIVRVGVAYDTDLKKVWQLIQEMGLKMQEASSDIIEPTCVQGISDFGDSEITLKMITKVKPGSHRALQRVIRKNIKQLFDENNIEIPFPRRVVYMKPE